MFVFIPTTTFCEQKRARCSELCPPLLAIFASLTFYDPNITRGQKITLGAAPVCFCVCLCHCSYDIVCNALWVEHAHKM